MINNEEGQKQALHICFVNNANNGSYNLTKTTIMKTLQIKRTLVFVLALASSSYGVAYDAAVQCTINSGSSKPVNAFIQFISNDPSISGEATKHVLIRP